MQNCMSNNITSKIKNRKYTILIAVLVAILLAGCNTYGMSGNKDNIEEDIESKNSLSESDDEVSTKKKKKTKSKGSDEEDNTESESENQKKKSIPEEPEFAKSSEWDKYDPVHATDMILQVGDVFIRYGDTVGDVFERFDNSEIEVSTEENLKQRGHTDPLDIEVFLDEEVSQGKTLWLTLRAEDPTFSWTLPISDYQIIGVDLSDDARDHSYLLDGKYYSEIRTMSYDDVLDLKGDFFPEDTFEMYEDKDENGYYTITYAAERDKEPLLIPNATRGGSRIQTEREYKFTIPEKSGTVLYYEDYYTRGGDMICIDPIDLRDDSSYDYDEDVDNPADSSNNSKSSKKDKGNSTEKKNNDYIIPYSGDRLLTVSDLSGLSSDELRKARNEIVARHGRRFKDQELQAYFDSKPWYEGTIDPDDFNDYTMLNEIERKNMNFIKDHER